MRCLASTLAGVAVAGGLAGCALSPEHDPHNLPYFVWPSDSPDVNHYSSNPYASATAPPLYAPPAGRP